MLNFAFGGRYLTKFPTWTAKISVVLNKPLASVWYITSRVVRSHNVHHEGDPIVFPIPKTFYDAPWNVTLPLNYPTDDREDNAVNGVIYQRRLNKAGGSYALMKKNRKRNDFTGCIACFPSWLITFDLVTIFKEVWHLKHLNWPIRKTDDVACVWMCVCQSQRIICHGDTFRLSELQLSIEIWRLRTLIWPRTLFTYTIARLTGELLRWAT